MEPIPLSCPVEKVELERIEWAISHTLTGRDLSFRKICAFLPVDQDALLIHVMGTLWAEEVGSETYRWPCGWLQAVRERWLPAWWLKRHPVVYESHCVRWGIGYPEFRPSCKGLGYTIPVLRDDSAFQPNSKWRDRREDSP